MSVVSQQHLGALDDADLAVLKEWATLLRETDLSRNHLAALIRAFTSDSNTTSILTPSNPTARPNSSVPPTARESASHASDEASGSSGSTRPKIVDRAFEKARFHPESKSAIEHFSNNADNPPVDIHSFVEADFGGIAVIQSHSHNGHK